MSDFVMPALDVTITEINTVPGTFGGTDYTIVTSIWSDGLRTYDLYVGEENRTEDNSQLTMTKDDVRRILEAATPE
jgi:hypothetical protein